MITRLDIENFRGFRRLVVEDLGRVNLIVGRNDCGKTSLAAAAVASISAEGMILAAAGLATRDGEEFDPKMVGDFENFWRPMFHGGDADRGARVGDVRIRATESGMFAMGSPSWSVAITDPKRTLTLHQGVPDVPLERRPDVLWTGAIADLRRGFRTAFERLVRDGREGMALDAVRAWNAGIERIELLGANVLVRLSGHPRPLPIAVLGDGSRRGIDLAVKLGAVNDALIGIDEIDAGLHHTTFRPLWAWLRRVAADRNHQVFATAHSDECVLAACRAFQEAGDDGLRVIRIDRTADGGHDAKVFHVDRALEMLENDAEIR